MLLLFGLSCRPSHSSLYIAPYKSNYDVTVTLLCHIRIRQFDHRNVHVSSFYVKALTIINDKVDDKLDAPFLVVIM